MKTKASSENTTGIYVVSPEFSLLAEPLKLDSRTADAFTYSDSKGRRMLFGMRRLLENLFPNGTHTSCKYDDYVKALKLLNDRLKSANLPESITIEYPGKVFPPCDGCFAEMLSSLNGSITLDLKDRFTAKYLEHLHSDDLFRNKQINLIADRMIHDKVMKTICGLWNSGADITICYGKAALNRLKTSGINADSFSLFNGIITIPGKTLIKSVPICASTKDDASYSKIKAEVEEIIERETRSRFSVSVKGKTFYRSTDEYDGLDPLGMFYKGSLSDDDKKIRGILCGGATYDIIALILQNGADVTKYAAACRSLDNLYPLIILPVLHDKRYAHRFTDVEEAISEHTELCPYAYGGALLELHVSDSLDLSDHKEIGRYVSAFFGTGGIALRIIKE